ncbi:MAG: GFA family protein [Gammaproteobacteria bacterium]|nr:GFA family protein [Gammaproteobacteria bacterium]
MSDQPFATGHCLCGTVHYTINTPPVRMAQCHCEHCRRASGTGHMSLAFFSSDDMTINGETTHFTTTADSGNVKTFAFCPTCGSRLFGTNSGRPGLTSVAVGTIDDSSWFKPEAIVYANSRPVWDQMDDSIPAFDTMPPAPK